TTTSQGRSRTPVRSDTGASLRLGPKAEPGLLSSRARALQALLDDPNGHFECAPYPVLVSRWACAGPRLGDRASVRSRGRAREGVDSLDPPLALRQDGEPDVIAARRRTGEEVLGVAHDQPVLVQRRAEIQGQAFARVQ